MRYGDDASAPASAFRRPHAALRPRRILLLPLLTLALLAVGAPLSGGLGLGPGGAALAKEPNQRPFLAPEYQVKVQRTIARGRRMQTGGGEEEEGGAIRPGQDVVQTGCGALQLGNVSGSPRPGQRAPRENIVVARDVINAPLGCR
jgi:hypothetical protein